MTLKEGHVPTKDIFTIHISIASKQTYLNIEDALKVNYQNKVIDWCIKELKVEIIDQVATKKREREEIITKSQSSILIDTSASNSNHQVLNIYALSSSHQAPSDLNPRVFFTSISMTALCLSLASFKTLFYFLIHCFLKLNFNFLIHYLLNYSYKFLILIMYVFYSYIYTINC